MNRRPGERALDRWFARLAGEGRDEVGLHVKARVQVKGVLVVVRDTTIMLKSRKRRPGKR